MKCTHDEPVFYSGPIQIEWCPVCGAINDDGRWQLPELARVLPEVLLKLATALDLAAEDLDPVKP